MAEKWEKLKHSAVEPVSAFDLFSQEQQRKRPRQRYSTTTTQSPSQQPTAFPCCWLQHPTFSMPMGSLTELAGPAGAGKTQLALSLCVDAVMMEGNGAQENRDNSSITPQNDDKPKAVYVLLGGSGRFLQTISRRLQQMIQARLEEGDAHNDPSDNQNSKYVHDCLTRIFIKWICNTEELLEMLRISLVKLLQDHDPHIECVVLDGIASLFRFQDERSGHKPWHQERAGTFIPKGKT